MTALFSELPLQISAARQIECLTRELKFRARVFRRRVEEGRMSQANMDEEIAAMGAALETVKLAKERGLVA